MKNPYLNNLKTSSPLEVILYQTRYQNLYKLWLIIYKMRVCALGSGSSGNCFFISENNHAVLIDAGFSCKETFRRLNLINQNPLDIKAIFITHEHTDHVKGADVLARHLNIPIYATKKTIANSFLCKKPELINIIKNNETIKINNLHTVAFSKTPKAADPVSYSILSEKRVSIITDLGHACQNTIDKISTSDLLFIESNYDEEMLENGPYPHFLKKWIKGNDGHLSNTQTGLCVLEHSTPKLKNVVLSHLSKFNNHPEVALKTFKDLIKERKDLNPSIHISLRDEPTKIFSL